MDDLTVIIALVIQTIVILLAIGAFFVKLENHMATLEEKVKVVDDHEVAIRGLSRHVQRLDAIHERCPYIEGGKHT